MPNQARRCPQVPPLASIPSTEIARFFKSHCRDGSPSAWLDFAALLQHLRSSNRSQLSAPHRALGVFPRSPGKPDRRGSPRPTEPHQSFSTTMERQGIRHLMSRLLFKQVGNFRTAGYNAEYTRPRPALSDASGALVVQRYSWSFFNALDLSSLRESKLPRVLRSTRLQRSVDPSPRGSSENKRLFSDTERADNNGLRREPCLCREQTIWQVRHPTCCPAGEYACMDRA